MVNKLALPPTPNEIISKINEIVDNIGGGGSSSSRNIGEIVKSTIPLTDAGLHLLDGGVIQRGSYTAFVDYISSLVSSYPDLFATESNWQASVSSYGVCGKFVYDSVNNTVRLPKYSNKIYTGGGTAPVVGNGMTLGLTDGTNNGGLQSMAFTSGITQNGELEINHVVYGVSIGSAGTQSDSLFGNNKGIGITTDATKSGIIADLSNITTSLDGYYYIVIATSTKTDIEVDIDEIATDLNGKADVDLSNINPTSAKKAEITSWGLPDLNRGISIAYGAAAPSNGYVLFTGSEVENSYMTGGINDLWVVKLGSSAYQKEERSGLIPVSQGDIIVFNNATALFYPMKGTIS